jgi:hypothetical protein
VSLNIIFAVINEIESSEKTHFKKWGSSIEVKLTKGSGFFCGELLINKSECSNETFLWPFLSTFYKQLLSKNTNTNFNTVIREKLRKTLPYKKGAHKMLINGPLEPILANLVFTSFLIFAVKHESI